MKKFLTISCTLFLLGSGLMSCTYDPKLDTARITAEEDVFIEEGRTYELIVKGETEGEPCTILTDCSDQKVVATYKGSFSNDGFGKAPSYLPDAVGVKFTCNKLTQEKYQIVPAILTVADSLGNLAIIEKGVLVPEGGLKPGDFLDLHVGGETYRLIKAKATNAFQLEQGENKIYFVFVPRA